MQTRIISAGTGIVDISREFVIKISIVYKHVDKLKYMNAWKAWKEVHNV